MEIKILEFISNPKNFKVGFVDFTVIYSPEKSETFRNVPYFVKDNRKWLSMPSVQRNGKWLPQYDRTPPMKDLLNEVSKAISDYLERNPIKINT